MKRILFTIAMLCVAKAYAWTPPIAVPDPGSVWVSEDSVTWDPMDLAIGTPTKYVDQNNPSCSDVGPGTSGTPLCNIPNSISAGEIIRVTDTDQSSTYYPGCYFKGDEAITFNGTPSSPAILSFVNAGFCDTSGSKVLVEFIGDNWMVDGMRSYGVRVFAGNKGATDPDVTHHYVIRNSEISWMNGGCVVMRGANGILYNNNIHHCIGDDAHTVQIQGNLSTSSSPRAKWMWIVDNTIHTSGGNGFQAKHGGATDSPDIFWFSRNEVYRNKETGFATKYTNRGLVSQNEFYENKYPGLKCRASVPASHCLYTMPDGVSNVAEYNARSLSPSVNNGSAGDGSGSILGADGPTDDIYIIANRFRNHDNVGPDGTRKGRGFRAEATEQLYFAQNIVYSNWTDAFANEKGIAGTSLAYVCNNTFVDRDGSRAIYWGFRDEADILWQNNIVYGTNSNPLLDAPQSGVAGEATMTHNIWYDTTGTMDYTWKNTTVSSLTTSAEINALDEAGNVISNNLFDNPDFTDVANNDFTLDSGASSPAIDSGTDCMTAIKTAYETDFGNYATTIMLDFDGNTVPTTSVDMGALQVGSSPPAPTDSLPVCVTCGQSPISQTAGDATFVYPVIMTDDDTDPVTITGFSCIDTSGASGTWSMDTVADPDEIEFSGTTAQGTVTCTWEMIDTGNSNTSAQLVFNIATADTEVPPTLAPINDQSNQETDTVQFSGSYTLTNGDAVSACSFSSCPSNLTQNLTLTHNNNCAGSSTTDWCITGDLPATSGGGGDAVISTTLPISTPVWGSADGNGSNPSGSFTLENATNANNAVACAWTGRSGSAVTATAFTFDGVAGTKLLDIENDGGTAQSGAIYYWVDANLPDTNTSYTVAVTTSGSSFANIIGCVELSDVDQTTPFGTPNDPDFGTGGFSSGGTLDNTLTGASGEDVLIWYMSADLTDYSENTSTITSNAETSVLSHYNLRSQMSIWHDASAASASELYTVTIGSTGNSPDSASVVAVQVNDGGGGVTGAATNSPHSCGIYCTDNDGNSNTETFTWTVTTAGANQQPVAVDDSYLYIPGETNSYTESCVLNNDTDPDGDSLTATTTLVTQPGSGTVTLTSDGCFTYTPGAGYKLSTFFEYQVCDAGPLCDTGRANLDPVPAPIITSNGGGATASVNIVEDTTAITDVNATGAGISYSITGTDCSFMTINSTTGVLAFSSAPDFETPLDSGADNTYVCSVVATNGTGTDTQTITVNVTDDGVGTSAPVISSNGGADTAAVGAAENQTAVTTMRASDVTAWSKCGDEDDSFFTITDSTAIGDFTTNFAVDANNLDITAHNLLVNEKITLTTTGTLPAPLATATTYFVKTVNGVDDIELSATQGGAVITLTDNGTGTHTITRVHPIGIVTFSSAPNFENPLDTGANNTYKVCGQATGAGGIDMQHITVTVTNVVETPTVTSPTTATIKSGATVVSPTQTCDETTCTFSEVTDTAAAFSISSAGVITKDVAASYDSSTPANNVFSYTIKSTSTAGDSSNHTITIVIQPTLTDERQCSARAVIGRFVREARTCGLY